MFSKHTIGIILLISGLYSCVQHEAVLPPEAVTDDSANTIVIDDDNACHTQIASSPLVDTVLEKITPGNELASLWQDPDHLADLLDEIDQLHDDGLNPEHYAYSPIRQIHARALSGNTLSGCEIDLINHAYVTALKDLHYGRVDPVEHRLFWYAKNARKASDPRVILDIAMLGIDQDVSQAFNAARPISKEYRDLRDAYQQALKDYPQSWTRIPGGKLVRSGDTDARVGLIRQRLRESGYLDPFHGEADTEYVFSPELSEAVKRFQKNHSLNDDGVVGPDTLAEMNIQPSGRLNQFRVNLERLRWFSQDREDTMVLVEIAGARISYVKDCIQRILTRVQAGRPKRKTPPLKSYISHITLNPTWTVPPTILKKDVLPAVRKDINYLPEHHIRVFDYSGDELDIETIDWNNPGPVLLRQDAGPGAALGKVAIRFPNPFMVYLHDTPNKKLFDTDKRFYSSGCVRVENAMTLTELLFESAPEILVRKMTEAEASDEPLNVNLPDRVPLMMVYWTVAAEDDGNVRFTPDIYGRDSGLLKLLEQQ